MTARYRNRDGYIHTQPSRSAFLELHTGGAWELLDPEQHGPAPWGEPDPPARPVDRIGDADAKTPPPAGPTAAPLAADRPAQADPADGDKAKARADAPAKPKPGAARSTWAAYATQNGVDPAGMTRDEIAARFT